MRPILSAPKMKTSSVSIPNGSLSIPFLVASILFGAIETSKTQARATLPGASDHLIVAGQRIGPISIGISGAELFKLMGDPTNTQTSDGSVYSYSFGSLLRTGPDRQWSLLALVKESRVIFVQTWDTRFATPEGVRVGDSQLAMEAKMKRPESIQKITDGYLTYSYKRGAINLHVVNGKIISIQVTSLHR
jgi:hypothetical protein